MAQKAKVDPIPKQYHTITPYLTVGDAAKALEFYAKAFDAEEVFRMDEPGGKIMHAEMRIGDSPLMLTDEHEAWGNRSPATIGGTGSSLMLYVENVDEVFQRALDAGAREIMPISDHFYGDRSGMLEDPWGHHWSVSTHVEDVSPEELDRRAKEMMGG